MKAIFAYLLSNIHEFLGVVESVLKLAVSIAHLTATTRDDEWLAKITSIFAKIKNFIADTEEYLRGR